MSAISLKYDYYFLPLKTKSKYSKRKTRTKTSKNVSSKTKTINTLLWNKRMLLAHSIKTLKEIITTASKSMRILHKPSTCKYNYFTFSGFCVVNYYCNVTRFSAIYIHVFVAVFVVFSLSVCRPETGEETGNGKIRR